LVKYIIRLSVVSIGSNGVRLLGVAKVSIESFGDERKQ